jgi:hypothetical protein
VLLLRLLPALLAVSSLACAAPLTCPAKGGAPWTELSSTHFVLRTDSDPSEARAMVARFESLWGALAQVIGRQPGHGQKFDVVRFQRRQDLFEISPHRMGYFALQLPGDLLESQPTVVFLGDDLADEDRETFLHELGHRFLHERFAAIPPWLHEGLAQYYETLRVEGGRIVLGETGGLDFSDRPFWWESHRGDAYTTQVPAFMAPKVWDLINADWTMFHPARASNDPTRDDWHRESANYAGAWKLVHYLLDGPDAADRARLTAFFAAVARGERPRDAFLETFGAELPRLEQSFHGYLTRARTNRRVVEYRAEPAATPPAERTMSDAEVHLLWARLLPWKNGSMDRERKQLDEALASDSGSPEVRYRRALFFLHEGQLDEASREIDAALAARPDEPRYLLARLGWYEERQKTLKETLKGGLREGVPTDLVDHLARTATSANQLRVAGAYVARRHAEDGFRLIDRSLATDPL